MTFKFKFCTLPLRLVPSQKLEQSFIIINCFTLQIKLYSRLIYAALFEMKDVRKLASSFNCLFLWPPPNHKVHQDALLRKFYINCKTWFANIHSIAPFEHKISKELELEDS